MKRIALIWEIPLALLSFVFYKVMKLIIGNLYILYLAIAREKASQWRVLSQETLKSPLSLPVLMTKGPRWNTHAIIGTLGPFQVKKSIFLDIESANNSASSWIAVVYSFPDYQTITSLESEKVNLENKWHFLEVEPGKYTLGLRYYNWCERVNLPAIKVDDRELVAPINVPTNVNNFYASLIQKKNWFYLSLHYYIFILLKLRKWLPESFVRKEYLPVGAPNTCFFYDYLERGQSLEVDLSLPVLNSYDIYFTLYDRSSLPLTWCQLKQEISTFEPTKSNGYYLFRIRAKKLTHNQELIKFQRVEREQSLQKITIS
ncbi:hypothetical protein IQ238_15210 [Pleurocapsales cyanobacterium LEGE 06147]|nr:hypothetical protein [Pleurocapsales cyanobacterium LEGE 06147]